MGQGGLNRPARLVMVFGTAAKLSHYLEIKLPQHFISLILGWPRAIGPAYLKLLSLIAFCEFVLNLRYAKDLFNTDQIL